MSDKPDHSQRRKTEEEWAKIQHPVERVDDALKARGVYNRHYHPLSPAHGGEGHDQGLGQQGEGEDEE